MAICVVGLLLGCSVNGANADNNSESKVTQEVQEPSPSESDKDDSTVPEHYSDEDFLSDLGKGLMKRWDVSDNAHSYFGSEEFKTDFLEFINIELDYIRPHKDAVFKNNELQTLAISYISILEKQISMLDDYPNNDFLIGWNEVSEERKDVLKQLLDNYPVPIDEKYNDIVAEFIEPENADAEET